MTGRWRESTTDTAVGARMLDSVKFGSALYDEELSHPKIQIAGLLRYRAN